MYVVVTSSLVGIFLHSNAEGVGWKGYKKTVTFFREERREDTPAVFVFGWIPKNHC